MKRYIKVILFLLFFLFAITFADNCPDICVSQPSYIQSLEQLSKNIFSITKIEKQKNEYWKGIVSDIKHLIEQVTTKWWNVIGCFWFYGNTLFSNSMSITFGIFTILKSPWAVVRDYSKLRDLADLVRNVYFTICWNNNIEITLNKEQQYQLKEAINYYNSEKPLIFVYPKNFRNWIKYQDVYEFLYYLINLHKDWLLKMMKAQDVDDVVSFLSWGGSIKKCFKGKSHNFCNYFTIKPNKDLISKLMIEYPQCSTCKVNFWDKVEKLVNWFKSNIWDDWDRIQKAYERLKESLLNVWGWLTDYEAKKASEYWWKEFKKWEGWINPFSYKRLQVNIDQNLKKQWKEFITPFSWMKAVWRAFRQQSFWVKKVWSWYNFETPTEKMLKDELVATIAWTLDLALLEANRLKVKEVKSDPTSITRLIPGITYRIKQAMYILGKKNIEWSIVWYLGKSCEKQCSNVGGICWYY